jgi:dTDP-4-dehydrorhamnose 3,5-epimerase
MLRNQKKNVFRGLHFQLNPFAQTKMVMALSGAVIDLVVDLRKTSENYLQYFKIKLDSPDKALFIPKGFAHGYYTLKDQTCIQYAVDKPYHPASERSLSIYDPMLKIKENFTGALISAKDLASDSFNVIEQEL